MISRYAFPLLLAGLATQAACAAPLYQWMDTAGHVTYSSFPPPAGTRARTVEIPPQPSAEETRQAAGRAKRMQEQASELEARRREQEAREAEEARLRAMQFPPAPIVIEKPVYVPQPIYYRPVRMPHRRHPDRPPRHRPR
ncbi:MAG: DUF4124 domain-containing protein [Hydrogenophilales bacterium]|nr:DUF4124 domain-containing protein [Hydrogenophilales bacterium]